MRIALLFHSHSLFSPLLPSPPFPIIFEKQPSSSVIHGARRPHSERLQVPSQNSWSTTLQLGRWHSPPWLHYRLRRRLRHRVVESSQQRSTGELFLYGAQAQEQWRLACGSKGWHRFLDSKQKTRTHLSPSSTGARWWWDERASFLQRGPLGEL